MTDTFTWDAQATEGTELTSVITAQFGDGYKQIAANGINTAAETWNLTWTGQRKAVTKIRAFLRTHITESFWWTNPWESDCYTASKMTLLLHPSLRQILLHSHSRLSSLLNPDHPFH